MNNNEDYRIVNGISFKIATPLEVCNILSRCNLEKRRVRLYYGKDGLCWMDENDTLGYVGKSSGKIKIPLLIKNRNSSGGGAILDDCVIKIVDTETKRVLYEHPKFKLKEVNVSGNKVIVGGEPYAVCESNEKAKRIAEFLLGIKNAK